MRYVAAYLLAALGGNESPKEGDIKAILESVGVGYEQASAERVVKQMAGKSIAELIENGSKQLASMPAGGGGASSGGASSGGAAAEAPKEEEKKKEESEEESDDDMGFGLFD